MSAKKEVLLIYFEGCPYVDRARQNLDAAFKQLNQTPQWTEIDLYSPDCPTQWGGFPSPSILIDGVEITTGDKTRPGTPSCHFGGAPELGLILSKLQLGQT